MEISQDLGHKNIVFIRFNPDEYMNNKNIRISSCWKMDKKGKLKLEKKDEWAERLSALVNQIQYWIDNDTERMIQIVELYYNEN